jgi:hypothetical protein
LSKIFANPFSPRRLAKRCGFRVFADEQAVGGHGSPQPAVGGIGDVVAGMRIQQRLAAGKAQREDAHLAHFINALQDAVALGTALQVVEFAFFAENAILAKHIAHQRGLKHDHVRQFEARAQMFESRFGDIGIFHFNPAMGRCPAPFRRHFPGH